MKYFILLLALLTGCGSSGGSSPDAIIVEESPVTVFVLCDSLGVGDDAWPAILEDITGLVVDSFCVRGLGAADSFIIPVLEPLDVKEMHQGYTVFLLALGGNDAFLEVDPEVFRVKYKALINHPNTLCILPPLTNLPDQQARMETIRRIIIEVCPVVIYPAPSDHEDNVHYTEVSARLQAEIINQYLQS